MVPARSVQAPDDRVDALPGRDRASMTARSIVRASRIAAAFLVGLALLFAVRVVDGSATLAGDTIAAAGSSLGLALLAVLLPWRRLGRWTTLVLPAAAAVLVGLSLMVSDAHPSSFLAYPLFGFVWLGLGYPPGTALRAVVPGLLLMTGPALLDGTDPLQLASYPVAFALGALVAELLARIVAEVDDAPAITGSSDRARASQVARLAHELRRPTATIAGTMRLLRGRERSLDDIVAAQVLETAERQAEWLLDLSDAVLDNDRVRAGALTLQLREVDPFVVLGRSSWVCGADLEVVGDRNLRVPADARCLQHLVTMVVDRAIRWGAPPFEAAVEAADGVIRLVVRDHGAGMLEQQSESAVGPTVPGGGENSTGLGLWLVRPIIEAHGGRVLLEDAEPGLRVILELPSG